ncbi:MAG TPA: FAD-binding protein [Pseudonocardiaceae bacterium]|jgi:FAD/FMN-containing dehydrogenase|nr:FAD-binding protein [Pseudonocardiaceae bacterium]
MTALATDLRHLLTGEIQDDPETLSRYELDYGQLLRRQPAAVIWPDGAADVAAAVRYAAARGIPVSPRGTGHSLRGQSANDGGLILDLTRLDHLTVDPAAREFRCDPGVRWRTVVATAGPHRLVPPVLTGYPHVTVAGTHSAGGWGDASFRYGAQVDNCTALEVVTGTGERLRCTAEHNAELFGHVLGGMGQFAVITAIEHRLREFRPLDRTYHLDYPDVASLLADCRTLVAADSPVDSLECRLDTGPDRSWRYRALVTIEADSARELPDHSPVPDLIGRLDQIVDLPTARTLSRPDATEVAARPGIAQPWMVAFLPWSRAQAFVELCLRRLPPNLLGGRGGTVRLWPAHRKVTNTPMLRVPDSEPEMVMVGIFPSVPTSQLPAALAIISRVSDLALESGGTRHLATWVHLDRPRWRLHFGEHWTRVNELKRTYDPAGVLNPGFVDYEPKAVEAATAED